MKKSKDQIDSESIARFDSAAFAAAIFFVGWLVLMIALGILGLWKLIELCIPATTS